MMCVVPVSGRSRGGPAGSQAGTAHFQRGLQDLFHPCPHQLCGPAAAGRIWLPHLFCHGGNDKGREHFFFHVHKVHIWTIIFKLVINNRGYCVISKIFCELEYTLDWSMLAFLFILILLQNDFSIIFSC